MACRASEWGIVPSLYTASPRGVHGLVLVYSTLSPACTGRVFESGTAVLHGACIAIGDGVQARLGPRHETAGLAAEGPGLRRTRGMRAGRVHAPPIWSSARMRRRERAWYRADRIVLFRRCHTKVMRQKDCTGTAAITEKLCARCSGDACRLVRGSDAMARCLAAWGRSGGILAPRRFTDVSCVRHSLVTGKCELSQLWTN